MRERLRNESGVGADGKSPMFSETPPRWGGGLFLYLTKKLKLTTTKKKADSPRTNLITDILPMQRATW